MNGVCAALLSGGGRRLYGGFGFLEKMVVFLTGFCGRSAAALGGVV